MVVLHNYLQYPFDDIVHLATGCCTKVFTYGVEPTIFLLD